MKWEKKGLIIKAEGQRNWMYSHTQVPVPLELEDRIRLYIATRPKPENGLSRSITIYIDLDKNNLSNILQISEAPILSYGELGTFDEHGIMPGTIIKKNNKIWLYYNGWKRTVSAPFTTATGLAISNDNGLSFTRYSKGPIFGLSPNEPYFIASGRVINEKKLFYFFYSSGIKWINDNNKLESIYQLRLAQSKDGITWSYYNDFSFPKLLENECQNCPTIFHYNGLYHMYFSYRYGLNFRNKDRGYKMGYAYSHDLINWNRNDSLAGIELSESGWDSEMICYPYVTKINNHWTMFYCGNYFGKDGIGYAILKEEE